LCLVWRIAPQRKLCEAVRSIVDFLRSNPSSQYSYYVQTAPRYRCAVCETLLRRFLWKPCKTEQILPRVAKQNISELLRNR